MGKNFWMVAESLENHETTLDRGLSVIGFSKPFRRRVQRMQKGDSILFYVSTIRMWTATASVTSEYFVDHTPIWKPTARGEQYAFRVSLNPDIRLTESQYIDASLIAPRLDYLRKWRPEDWPLAFIDRLHLIPQKDFRLIEDEMYRITGRRPRPPKQQRRRKNRRHQPAGGVGARSGVPSNGNVAVHTGGGPSVDGHRTQEGT